MAKAAEKSNWQDRVVSEKVDLDEKIEKLTRFITSDEIFVGLPIEEQDLLRAQLMHMQNYSGLLNQRILRFKQN